MVGTRVLHVKPGGWVAGGVEAFLMSMLENIDRSRVVFDVLTIVDSDVEGPYDGRLRRLGGRRYICLDRGRGPRFGRLRPVRALYRLVREEGYDTVHIHTGSPFHGVYAYASRLAGARTVIIHSHTTGGRELPVALKGLLDKVLGPAPTHRAACSIAAARWLFPDDVQAAVQVFRNGIDVEAFRHDPATRARVRAELGIAEGRLVLGHVGRLSWEKNHRLTLESHRALVDGSTADVPPLLLLVGDGEERAGLEAYASELGISEHVRFLGRRDDIAALMQAMDVLLLPSRAEGLGIVAVEAQAAGLPCVLSTGVPVEVDVTGRCTFLPVTAPATYWAAAIGRAAALPRRDGADRVRAAGYDARDCARELVAFYLRGESPQLVAG